MNATRTPRFVVKLHEPLIVLGRKPFRTTSIDGGPFLPGTDSCQSDLSPNLLKRPLFAHYCCQLDPSARLRQKARMAAKVRVEAFSRWPATGGAYFHGLGRQTARHWSEFLTTLNTIPANSAMGANAEAGAIATFLAFRQAIKLIR